MGSRVAVAIIVAILREQAHGFVRLPARFGGFPTLGSTAEADVAARPVPKVPASAWKWPPVWPFPEDYLEVITDEANYTSTGFSAAQISAFRKHVGFYLEPGSKLLEIGELKDSSSALLSTGDYSGSRIEFLPLSGEAFNGQIGSKIEHSPGSPARGIPFSDGTFDAVVVSNGVEAFKNPRDAFRDIWRVLKPKGKCVICFAGKPNVPDLLPIKMWTTMTDEQKIWIAGSYYQYSAGEGWENIEG